MKLTDETAVCIREAAISDKPVLLQFEQELIAAERPMDPTIREGHIQYNDMDDLISNPSVYFLVAEAEGRLIGCGYGRPKPARSYLDHPSYAYFGFMYTEEEYRGRGINELIMRHLRAWAMNQGLNEIRLTVYPGNKPAIRAYEKVGFHPHLVEMRFREE